MTRAGGCVLTHPHPLNLAPQSTAATGRRQQEKLLLGMSVLSAFPKAKLEKLEIKALAVPTTGKNLAFIRQ